VDEHEDTGATLTLAERDRIARHLAGDGIEVGPGSNPFPIPPGATVRYVDRWTPDEARRLYPELTAADFYEPDAVSNFDVDRLEMFDARSLDFVIASHVLEHLADPLGFLGEMHRVLRPGGIAIVLLPDRRHTFDRTRPPTSLQHLIEDHERGVTRVDDDHVEEFLTLADEEASYAIAPDPENRDAFYDWHRERSIHVHCWTETEFYDVLIYAIVGLGQAWEVVERVPLQDDLEFGYVLRRPRLRGVWERVRATAVPAGGVVRASTDDDPAPASPSPGRARGGLRASSA
jgi:SAM-dependent methyltransferase